MSRAWGGGSKVVSPSSLVIRSKKIMKSPSKNVNPWIEVTRYIWFNSGFGNGGSSRGYYYVDETADLKGPFSTEKEADEAFHRYQKALR